MTSTDTDCRPRSTREAGYTLVETALALVITTVVVAAGYASYQFAHRLVADWKQGVMLENAAHRILRDISTQVRTATILSYANQSFGDMKNGYRLVFKQKEGGRESTVTYDLNDTSLKRNGHSMHASSVSVLRMKLTSLTLYGRVERVCLNERSTSTTSGTASRLVRLRLDVATRGDTIRICTAIHPRESTSW